MRLYQPYPFSALNGKPKFPQKQNNPITNLAKFPFFPIAIGNSSETEATTRYMIYIQIASPHDASLASIISFIVFRLGAGVPVLELLLSVVAPCGDSVVSWFCRKGLST